MALITDPPTTSFTNTPEKKKNDNYHVTRDKGHVTCDTAVQCNAVQCSAVLCSAGSWCVMKHIVVLNNTMCIEVQEEEKKLVICMQ